MPKKQKVEDYKRDQQAFYLKHAAFLIGISDRTLRRWVKKGKVHHAWQHDINNWWYFPLEEINSLRKADGKQPISREDAINKLIKIYKNVA